MLTLQGGDSLVGGLPIIHITYQQYIANPSAYHDPDVIVHISGFPTAGNMPADYVGYDSNLNMEDIGNIATKAIAKVEPSDTALYLHEVGTGFINKDGNYCITDVQIAVGGSIALGTNCHVVDGGISSNIPKIYTIDIGTYATSDGNPYLYVFNNKVAILVLHGIKNLSSNYQKIGELPINIRPSTYAYSNAYNETSHQTNCRIQANGGIEMMVTSGSVSYSAITMIFQIV